MKLLKSSIKMNRSISQQRVSRKKKLKRLKSACNYQAESSRFKNSRKPSADALKMLTKDVKNMKKKRKVSGLLRNKKHIDDIKAQFTAPYGTNQTQPSAVNIELPSSDAGILRRLRPTRLEGEPDIKEASRNSKCSLRSA